MSFGEVQSVLNSLTPVRDNPAVVYHVLAPAMLNERRMCSILAESSKQPIQRFNPLTIRQSRLSAATVTLQHLLTMKAGVRWQLK